jgi:hypothetical protein
MKKKRGIIIGLSLFAFAFAVAILGAGFSWRQVLLGSLALFIWELGSEIWKATFADPGFTRIQFRIGLVIGKALYDAGLYADDSSDSLSKIAEKMPDGGWITFTWLEPDFFFINTANRYSSTLEFSVDLPMIGTRQNQARYELTDMIEMRSANDGYELVLLTREERYCWPGTTRDKGLVLFSLPFRFLWAFQGKGDAWDREKKAHKMLAEIPGLEYHELADVPTGWDYQNEYGSFRWWTL